MEGRKSKTFDIGRDGGDEKRVKMNRVRKKKEKGVKENLG